MCEEGRPFWGSSEDFQTNLPIHPSSFLEITPHKFCIFWKWPQPEYSSNKLCLSSPHTLSTVVSLRSVFTIYSCCIQFWFKLSIARYPLCNAPTGIKQQASQTVMWPSWWINLDCFSFYFEQSWQVEQGCIKFNFAFVNIISFLSFFFFQMDNYILYNKLLYRIDP